MFSGVCVHAHDKHEELDAGNDPRAAPA